MVKDMNDDITRFSEYLLIERNYSDNTDINYTHDLDEFESYLDKHRLNYLNVTNKDINTYILYLKKELKYNSASINRHLSCLRSFYNYLVREEKIRYNPLSVVRSQKKELRLPNYMKYSEFEDMVAACDSTPLGIRNRCIFELLLATGCRISELINIKVNDIDLINNEIKVSGKGNKDRIVYFTDFTKNVLKMYLKDARNILLNGKNSEYLFINHIGTHLTTRGVRDVIDRILLIAGTSAHVTPHTFRHTFATMLLNEGCDLRSVQDLLGHANMSTTSIYTHVSNDRIKDIYLHTHPRAKK